MYSRTKQDSCAKALVKEMVEEEIEHSQWLESFKKGSGKAMLAPREGAESDD